MPEPTPEPEERLLEDVVYAIADADRDMNYHDMARAAITAYQSATEAALTEAEHRAERYREALQAIALNPGWSNLSDIALAALDTTAGPGGTG